MVENELNRTRLDTELQIDSEIGLGGEIMSYKIGRASTVTQIGDTTMSVGEISQSQILIDGEHS